MDLSILTRLCPGAVDVSEPTSRSTGQKLENSDIAAALALGNLQRGPYLYGLAKYCHDESVCGELIRYARNEVVDLATSELWVKEFPLIRKRAKVDGDLGITKAFAQLALYELISDGTCNTCQGVAEVVHGTQVVTCGVCKGSGKKSLSEDDRRRILGDLGVGFLDWRQWRLRYGRSFNRLQAWDGIVSDHLGRKL